MAICHPFLFSESMKTMFQELLCKGPLEEVNALKKKVASLENELVKKQEHINQTNAYYKKKMRDVRINRNSK